MSRPARKSKSTKLPAPVQERLQPAAPLLLTPHRLNMLLMGVALCYALLAGLHTVFDFDMGWQMATGRYVVQHHTVPGTDVLSYTSAGELWLYSPFAGVLLYGIYSALGGYAALSCFCALTLLAMVACLLRAPGRQGSAMAAALAILAVPSLALRSTPRADLFTHLFFAIVLAVLWNVHRSGPGDDEAALRRRRLRLWIVPPVMVLWVNFHPGFIAGVGLLFGYLALEALELPFAERRVAALGRLRRAWPVLLVSLCCTLLNPYGPRIFRAALQLAGLQPADSAGGGATSIVELSSMRLTLPALAQALEWRSPESCFWWLAAVAVLAIGVALWRRQAGAALLLAAAFYECLQRHRYQGLFAIVAVIIGGSVLDEGWAGRSRAEAKAGGRMRFLPVIAAGVLSLLTCVHIADLVSSRSYLISCAPELFGSGESSWFPERAAAFIEREHLPGNLLQTYALGGYAAWRLGPRYGDYIDGRNVNPAVWSKYEELMTSSPDSRSWEQEADRRQINILFFPLHRVFGAGIPNLLSLCQSRLWRPVYMDETGIVLLRNQSRNSRWLEHAIDCQSQRFEPPAGASRTVLADFHANAGNILRMLGRNDEAEAELKQSALLEPADPTVHMSLAQVYLAQQRMDDGEAEYQLALSERRYTPALWSALGRLYLQRGRYAEARRYILTALLLTSFPAEEYKVLGKIDLRLRQPEQALADFTQAEQAAARSGMREEPNRELYAQIAEGRAQAYYAQHDLRQALQFQKTAAERTPEVASRWKTLAQLYEATGEKELAAQARQHAQGASSQE